MKLSPLPFGCLLALALWPGASPAATFTNDTLIAAGNGAYDGQDIVVQNCTLTVNGPHAFNSLRLTNNAVLTHSAATSGQADLRLALTIAQGVSVDGTSRIEASGRGYAAASGPGAGASSATQGGGGAGHGGLGGLGLGGGGPGATYDAVTAPAQPGSGGGHGYFSLGGPGGGWVQLTIAGTFRLDGGLLANGGDSAAQPYGGGGAGGSIAVTAGTLTGFGVISANGGAALGGSGGGGAGGRIALQVTTQTFAGAVTAYGGSGAQFGGAGTVFVKVGATPGEVRVDNGGNAGQFTPLATAQPLDLVVANRAIVYPLTELTNSSLTLKTNGLVTCAPDRSLLTLTVLGDAVIEPGGRVEVSGLGYAPGTGPGAGSASTTAGGGGGGHGGLGGTAEGAGGGGYGSITSPTHAGSGGGAGFASTAGAGGGVLRLRVGGALQVDGRLAANGADSAGYANGGGGAGGSVFLTVGALRGTGAITADGGANVGGNAGGGAGGRIAIYHGTNTFTGTLSALGGAGFRRGGAGTVFLQAASATHGAVWIHNGGQPGITRLNPSLWPVGNYFDLFVSGAAQVNLEQPLTLWSLVLSNSAVLSHEAGQSGCHLTTLGDARVDAGAAIRADALGYASASGPGAGGSATTHGGGGGGHGGAGGAWTNTAAGGSANGSLEEPVNLGSGGGAGYHSRGGFGGGALRLSIGGLLQLNGSLTAHGGPGLDYNYGGGGAGGSIYVTADILTGTGLIAANGGASQLAGGGAGGRIALYPRLLVGFTNVPSVLGGTSGSTNLAGAAGTVYYASNVAPLRVLSALPSGPVMRPVSGVDVIFSAAVNPSTFTPADVVVTTPTGVVPTAQVVITPLAGPLYNVAFPVQTNLGSYQVKLGPHLQDATGRELDQNGNRIPGEDPGDAYTNTFTLVRPVVSGAVRAANGWPVRGATVRAADNSVTTTTDTNGLYSLTLPLGWTGSLLPVLTGATFTPPSRAYTGLDANLANQDFTLATDLQPTLSLTLSGTNANLAWPSLPAYRYQLQSSESLLQWQNVGSVTNGTGAAILRVVPRPPAVPNRSFRVQVLLN